MPNLVQTIEDSLHLSTVDPLQISPTETTLL